MPKRTSTALASSLTSLTFGRARLMATSAVASLLVKLRVSLRTIVRHWGLVAYPTEIVNGLKSKKLLRKLMNGSLPTDPD